MSAADTVAGNAESSRSEKTAGIAGQQALLAEHSIERTVGQSERAPPLVGVVSLEETRLRVEDDSDQPGKVVASSCACLSRMWSRMTTARAAMRARIGSKKGERRLPTKSAS